MPLQTLQETPGPSEFPVEEFKPLASRREMPQPLQNLQETLGPLKGDVPKPLAIHWQMPGNCGKLPTCQDCRHPQLDGADPDLDNLMNCKHESDKCQYRGSVIIPGYAKSDIDILNDYCMKACRNLNYGHIKENLNKQFKDSRIYTNFRKWRKCPKYFHLPNKNCILKYVIAR